MEQNNHHETDSKGEITYSINLTFFLSTYRVLITLEGQFQVDLRGTNFADLIGFEKKLVTSTEYGTKLPNITNSVDSLNINTTAIKDSVVNGVNTNTIAVIPTENLTRSYPFTFEPKRELYCPVSSNNISEIRVYITDSIGRSVDLNGIDWFITLILSSKNPNSITIKLKCDNQSLKRNLILRQENLLDSMYSIVAPLLLEVG